MANFLVGEWKKWCRYGEETTEAVGCFGNSLSFIGVGFPGEGDVVVIVVMGQCFLSALKNYTKSVLKINDSCNIIQI